MHHTRIAQRCVIQKPSNAKGTGWKNPHIASYKNKSVIFLKDLFVRYLTYVQKLSSFGLKIKCKLLLLETTHNTTSTCTTNKKSCIDISQSLPQDEKCPLDPTDPGQPLLWCNNYRATSGPGSRLVVSV